MFFHPDAPLITIQAQRDFFFGKSRFLYWIFILR